MIENNIFGPLPGEDEEQDPIRAQDKFTDRNDFKKILIDATETPQSINEYRVKVFYGAGGQGKSALKNDFYIDNYLCSKAEEDKNLIYIDKIDFERQPKTRLVDEALILIAEDLIVKGKIPLPAFCLGFMRYKMMTSAEKNFEDKYPFLYKIKFVSNDITNEIFGAIINSVMALAGAGSQTIGLGYLTKMISGKVHKFFLEWIQKSNVKKILGDLDELNSIQLLDRLPLLLAYDVNKFLREGNEEGSMTPKKRIVVLIDGYEKLWEDVVNAEIDKDAWIRTLVENIPGLLFVIFGRDRIRWAEITRKEAYNAVLDQHLIRGLSDQDAAGFLALVGIQEEDIREAIIATSKNPDTPEDGCLPFYLDIQVKTYKEIVRSGNIPTKENFNKYNEEVIKHFFEHLHEHVAEAIKTLSLAKYINEEIIELFVEHNFIHPSVSMKSLCKYSFIYLQNDTATIHGLMKEMAAQQFQSEFALRYRKIHEILFSYYENKLPSAQHEINSDIDRLLGLASYHKEIIDKKGYYQWAVKKAGLFYGKDLHKTLTNILSNALILYFETKGNELGKKEIGSEDLTVKEIHDIGAINYYLANLHGWRENFAESEKSIKECLRTINFILTEEAISQIKVSQGIEPEYADLIKLKEWALESYASTLESLDRYVEAGTVYNQAYVFSTDFGLAFDNNAYALYLSNVGKYAEAEPRLFERYRDFKQQSVKLNGAVSEELGLAAHNLARVLSRQGRYDEAIKYHNESIHIYKELRHTDHEYYAAVNEALCNTVIQQNTDLSLAEKGLNEVYEIYRKKYVHDHLTFGYYYSLMGDLYTAKKDLVNAKLYYEKGAQILANQISPVSKSILESLFKQCFLMKKLYDEGKVEREEYTIYSKSLIVPLKNNFELFKNKFSIYNPVFHDAIAIVSEALKDAGDVVNAEIFRRRRNEFLRITEKRTAIRANHYESGLINEADKTAMMKLIGSAISLPDDETKIELYKIHLPFYEEYSLFKIHYRNTLQFVQRYVLSNGVKVFPINYSNAPIYEVNYHDILLTAENVCDYIAFFFDSVCGRYGFFYVITDPSDLPWKIDIDIPDQYKELITSVLRPFKIIAHTEDKFDVELFILFQSSIFKSCVTVYRKDIVDGETQKIIHHKGNCELSNEMLCAFRENGQLVFPKDFLDEAGSISRIYKDGDGNEITLDSDEMIYEDIAACIDPSYNAPKGSIDESSFHEKLILGLTVCRNYCEHFLNFADEEETKHYSALYDRSDGLLSRLQNKEQCTINELIALISDVGGSLVKSVGEFKESLEPEDYRIVSFQYDVDFLKFLASELANMQKEPDTSNT